MHFAQIRLLTLLLLSVVLMGTIGYWLIEGWHLEDGFYMSVITLATVGYGETRELSPLGRIFTCGLIFVSLATLSCWTASITGFFVDRQLIQKWQSHHQVKRAQKMKSHTIVCGSNSMARTVVQMLIQRGQPVVVVDADETRLEQLRSQFRSISVVLGNPVDELTLANANVLGAESIVAVLDSAFDNLLITMTCNGLETGIRIVARADDPDIASRMNKLGVHEIICPYFLCAERATEAVLASEDSSTPLNAALQV